MGAQVSIPSSTSSSLPTRGFRPYDFSNESSFISLIRNRSIPDDIFIDNIIIQRNELLNHVFENNNSILHLAITYYKPRFAIAIINSIDFTRIHIINSNRQTALVLALEQNYPEVARAILSKTDVDIGLNQLTSENNSVLMTALRYCPEIAPEIMAREDFTQWNCVSRPIIGFNQFTALDFAICYERIELALFIARNPKFTNIDHIAGFETRYEYECEDQYADYIPTGTTLEYAIKKSKDNHDMIQVVDAIRVRQSILIRDKVY